MAFPIIYRSVWAVQRQIRLSNWGNFRIEGDLLLLISRPEVQKKSVKSRPEVWRLVLTLIGGSERTDSMVWGVVSTRDTLLRRWASDYASRRTSAFSTSPPQDTERVSFAIHPASKQRVKYKAIDKSNFTAGTCTSAGGHPLSCAFNWQIVSKNVRSWKWLSKLHRTTFALVPFDGEYQHL